MVGTMCQARHPTTPSRSAIHIGSLRAAAAVMARFISAALPSKPTGSRRFRRASASAGRATLIVSSGSDSALGSRFGSAVRSRVGRFSEAGRLARAGAAGSTSAEAVRCGVSCPVEKRDDVRRRGRIAEAVSSSSGGTSRDGSGFPHADALLADAAHVDASPLRRNSAIWSAVAVRPSSPTPKSGFPDASARPNRPKSPTPGLRLRDLMSFSPR